MELILELIVTPVFNAILATFEFMFWTICWAIWQIVRGVSHVGSALLGWRK